MNLLLYLTLLVGFRIIPKLTRNSDADAFRMLVVSMTSFAASIKKTCPFQVTD